MKTVPTEITVRIPEQVQRRFDLRPQDLQAFCERNRIAELSFFGSVLRDDFGPDSDIDVLFREIPGRHDRKRRPFRDPVAVAASELGAMLGRHVDLIPIDSFVSKRQSRPRASEEILATRVVAYADQPARQPMKGATLARRRHEDVLLDLLEHARSAVDHLGNLSRKGLAEDGKTAFAVIHAVQCIGEATNSRLDPSFRDGHPEIPWGEIIGMRNRCVHGYDNTDTDILHDTVRDDLPTLITFLEHHVPPLLHRDPNTAV